MQKKTKYFILFIILLIALVIVFGFLTGAKTKPSGKLDGFAQCISNSGAKFYGAFWCSHCQAQKKAFGSSVEYLPYVECSSADGKSQEQVCVDAGIESYPTWKFADGTELSGELSFETLSQKTGCALPQ